MTAGADRYERRASAGPMQIASSASWTGRRVAIGLAVGDDRLDAERPAGAQDAQRDLAAVGDEDLAEHAQASARPARGRELDEDRAPGRTRPPRPARRGSRRRRRPPARRPPGGRRACRPAEPVAGADPGPGARLGARLEDADRRRGRDDPAALAARAVAAVAAVARPSRPPSRRRDPARPGSGRSARASRLPGAGSGGALALARASLARRRSGRRASPGRRRRTRQSPSRTSSSPRPVAASLAMRAGRSSSVRRSIAAWSAARSAAVRSGAAIAGRGPVRARSRPPHEPAARRATTTGRPRRRRADPGRAGRAGDRRVRGLPAAASSGVSASV